MCNTCDFARILKTECNLLHFTRKCRIKNSYDFETNEAETNFWKAGFSNVKEKEMTIFYVHHEQMLWSIDETLSQSQS